MAPSELNVTPLLNTESLFFLSLFFLFFKINASGVCGMEQEAR